MIQTTKSTQVRGGGLKRQAIKLKRLISRWLSSFSDRSARTASSPDPLLVLIEVPSAELPSHALEYLLSRIALLQKAGIRVVRVIGVKNLASGALWLESWVEEGQLIRQAEYFEETKLCVSYRSVLEAPAHSTSVRTSSVRSSNLEGYF